MRISVFQFTFGLQTKGERNSVQVGIDGKYWYVVFKTSTHIFTINKDGLEATFRYS